MLLDVRTKTLKTLRRKHRGKALCVGFGNDLLEDMTPRAQSTKGKIDKLDFIKIKNFCGQWTLSTE